jgi:hypothetical protein
MRQTLWLSHVAAWTHHGEDFRQWPKAMYATQYGGLNVEDRLHHISIAGSNPGGVGRHLSSTFPPPYLQVLLKISWREFRKLWEFSVPLYYGFFERMLCDSLPSARKWAKSASNTNCNNKASMGWSWYLAPFNGDSYLENKRLGTYFLWYFI